MGNEQLKSRRRAPAGDRARRACGSRARRVLCSPCHPRTRHPLRDGDDEFAFIAGYTEGGAPYGITWEEMEALDARTERPPDPFRRPSRNTGLDVPRVNGIPVMDDDESLPF